MTQTRVLVFDDFPEDQQALMASILEANGDDKFDTVRTGDEAVATFETMRRDYVIVDYCLKLETGLDTEGVPGGQADVRDVAGICRELTNNVNQMANKRDIEACYRAGANTCLQKKMELENSFGQLPG